MSSSNNTHKILILGANFGGIPVAHYLLRHTITALKAASPSTSFHVTLVGPSTHFFFKIASPRAISDKTYLDRSLVPIEPAFASYSTKEFTFVQGLATAVDAKTRTATIKLSKSSETRQLKYDSLVISVGNKTASDLWAVNGTVDLIHSAFNTVHTALPNAKTVLIAGGGPAGVETAGEIAEKFPAIDITILSGTDRLLSRLSQKSSRNAQRKLEGMGVKVVHNTRVHLIVTSDHGRTTLRFKDGSERTVDLYIDSTGGSPNTAFLPSTWLDPTTKRVLTDNLTMRGKGADMHGVYAIGDAASYSGGGALDVNFSVVPLCRALGADVAAELVGKAAGGKPAAPAFREKTFSMMKDTQFVPISSQGGVGQVMGWSVPSWFVWMAKSRDFFIGQAVGTANGVSVKKV